jgi:hypothetical protein
MNAVLQQLAVLQRQAIRQVLNFHHLYTIYTAK